LLEDFTEKSVKLHHPVSAVYVTLTRSFFKSVKKSIMTKSRRSFLCAMGAGAVALPLSTLTRDAALLAAEPPKLSLDNPTAKALQYVHESPDAAKLCSGCQLYTGSADAEWGPCAIFPGTVVAAGGWCVSWSAKA
jgi:hypothetical protein